MDLWLLTALARRPTAQPIKGQILIEVSKRDKAEVCFITAVCRRLLEGPQDG